MIRLITNWLGRRPEATRRDQLSQRLQFNPEPPPGFVRRSDPNFYFLARKF